MSFFCAAVKRMPIILCIITPISVFITYGLALANDHVTPFWPYISDTGTKSPESCVFGLLLNIISFLLCMVIYIRYREVSEFCKIKTLVRISPLWNRIGAVLGFISCLGLSVVANFQETNLFTVHVIGALMCFSSGTLYFLLQTVFTRRTRPRAKCLLWSRTVLTLLNLLFFIGTFAPVEAAMKEFKGKDILKWSVKDGGFVYHAISTVSEWFLVFSFCAYICTIFWDFRRIDIEPPSIRFHSIEEEEEEAAAAGETSVNETDVSKDGAKSFWI